ncbi:MAG: LuxR C-terminal-related transcriptional regulator [Propionicimonas sp.]
MTSLGPRHDARALPGQLSPDRVRLVERLVNRTEVAPGSGLPSLVSLQGDAGQGKSTMLATVLAEARARGRVVVQMMGSALSAGLPYAALFDMVTDPSNSIGREAQDLAQQLASFQASTSPLAVACAIGDWLQELSRDRDAMLLVDDADLVDEDSLRVLAYAVTRYAPETTTVIYSLTRAVPILDRLQVTSVRLKDLGRHDALSLAVEAGASEPSAEHLVNRLGGNPLALLHAAPAYGDAADPWPRDVPVAARLERDVDARMDPLGPEARRVLVGAAVTGEVGLQALSAYTADTQESLDDVLDGLERSGLVRVRHDQLQWRRLWMGAAVARRCKTYRRERLTAQLERGRRVGSGPKAPEHPSDQLTASERRVVEVIIAGASMKDAADQLFLSARTVGSHLQSAYRKLGVHSRSQLAALLLAGEAAATLAFAG